MPQLFRRAVASVVSRSPLPIAYGEHLFGAAEFGDALADGWPDIVQPDPSISGGLSECLQVATIAAGHGVPVMPHAAAGPLAMAAGLHLAAIRQNVQLLEHAFTLEPMWEVLVGPQLSMSSIVDGALAVPSGPGLGVEVDEDGATGAPLPAQVLRHVDATTVDRGDLTTCGVASSPIWVVANRESEAWPPRWALGRTRPPRCGHTPITVGDHGVWRRTTTRKMCDWLVALDRPAVGDRPRVHEAVAGTELDAWGRPANSRRSRPSRRWRTTSPGWSYQTSRSSARSVTYS